MEENEIVKPSSRFPTGKKELWLLCVTAVFALLLTDLAMYYGCNIGFAVIAVLCIAAGTVYLLAQGHRPTFYSGTLLILSAFAFGSLSSSDDSFVKFVMIVFGFLGASLGFCLMAGQSRRSAAGFLSLTDAIGAFFGLGFGQFGNSFGGLHESSKNAGTAGKNRMAVFIGLLIAVPVLAIVIPLLMRADAAFEGLLALLPEFNLGELIVSVLFGAPLAAVLYTYFTALHHKSREARPQKQRKGINVLTVNTVLGAVCAVYLVYLLSQLAYFSGGFSGILPEEYTMAEYARRGFFEMAWLTAINLLIIIFSVAFIPRQNGKSPVSTRILCLFIALISLFFAVSASAKMLLYIDSYGLTRLRLLTEVIMVFLGSTVIFITVWIFAPKFPYMKAVMLCALVIGCAVAWADVDTVVASYNVSAYRAGQLETLDMDHLCELGDGAVPYLALLTEDDDPTVATLARYELEYRSTQRPEDIRSYTVASIIADNILEQYEETVP